MSTIKPLVAGNWKMNGLRADISEFAAMAGGYTKDLSAKADAMICPAFTLIAALANHPDSGDIKVGAQDCHTAASGAHTGDISAGMLADCGATAIIVGHSERRTDHGETDELVAEKALAVWNAGLVAIICVGETEAERRAGTTLQIVEKQLEGSVPVGATPENTVVAYEPVWAIGTGLTPSTNDVAEVHAHMRKLLESRFADAGQNMRLLYGGSVKAANAKELMSVPDVNGALVGGASLKASEFLGIIAAIN
ncbi:MAG: triose-phosphate isomerase [Hyphomicrobiales bacterium]